MNRILLVFPDFVFLTGVALVLYGIYRISPSASIILSGILLVLFALAMSKRKPS